MLIGSIFLRHSRVVLRDVDGSEVEIPAEDAYLIYTYVMEHRQEITEIMRREVGKIGQEKRKSIDKRDERS